MRGVSRRLSGLAVDTARPNRVAIGHEVRAMRIRRITVTLRITALAVGLVAGAAAVHAQIPCAYEIQIIQGPFCEPFGFPPTSAKGISETGEVVGFYNSCVVGPMPPTQDNSLTVWLLLKRRSTAVPKCRSNQSRRLLPPAPDFLEPLQYR